MDSFPKPIANILKQFFILEILFNIVCAMGIMIQEIPISPDSMMKLSTLYSAEQYLHK